METVFFELPSFLYAAQTDSGIILLNAQQDKYISITGASAAHLKTALEGQIAQRGELFFSDAHAENQDEFNQNIRYFLEHNIIQKSDRFHTNYRLQQAIEPGGLVDYQWDRKEQLVTADQAHKLLTLKCFFTVMRIDITMRRKGIAGIISAIDKHKRKCSAYRKPTCEEIEQLSNALDRACSFYPKKLFCLAWSSAFVLMALKLGYQCNLVIGVQSPPFYAHAWAQVGNSVINDNPIIQSRLAIIFKTPFNNE